MKKSMLYNLSIQGIYKKVDMVVFQSKKKKNSEIFEDRLKTSTSALKKNLKPTKLANFLIHFY